MSEIHEVNLALKAMNRGDEVLDTTCVVSLGTGLAPKEKLDTVNFSSYLDFPKSYKG